MFSIQKANIDSDAFSTSAYSTCKCQFRVVVAQPTGRERTTHATAVAVARSPSTGVFVCADRLQRLRPPFPLPSAGPRRRPVILCIARGSQRGGAWGHVFFFCKRRMVVRMRPHGSALRLNSKCCCADVSRLLWRCRSQKRIYTVPKHGISARSHFHAPHDHRLLSPPLLCSALAIRHVCLCCWLFPPPTLSWRAFSAGESTPSGFFVLPLRHARLRRQPLCGCRPAPVP